MPKTSKMSFQKLHLNAEETNSDDLSNDPPPEEEEFPADLKFWFLRRGTTAPDMAFPTYDEFDHQVRTMSQTIISSWAQVQNFCLAGGDMIERRWMKKSRKVRKSLLLQAFPRMPKEHNPGFRTLLWNDPQPPKYPFHHVAEEAVLWPSLNLDDLSRPEPLLLLLNARGRNHPEVFVSSDVESLVLGFAMDVLQQKYLPGYEIGLQSQDDERPYAVLRPFHRARLEEIVDVHGMRPCEGFYVLKIQSKVLSFLVDISRLILHDIDTLPAEVCSRSSWIRSEISTDHTGSGQQASLGEIAIEAAYQAPASVNLDTLESLVLSRLEAAQDHAWDLRQDPTYFFEVMTEATTHYTGDGSNNAGLRNDTRTEWWLAMTVALGECYANVALWNEVHTLLHGLILLKEMLEPGISGRPSAEWPEHYLQAILELGGSVVGVSLLHRHKLRDEVYCSPPLRHFWKERETSGVRARNAPFLIPRQAYSMEQFPTLIAILTMRNVHHVYPLHQITEHIERLLEADTSMARKITRLVGDRLADIQVLEEVRRQLHQYCPEIYCPGRTYKRSGVNQSTSATLREYHSCKGDLWDIYNVIIENQWDLFAPNDGQLHYPADKPRSSQRVEQMQRAERRLDLMWSKFDEAIGKIHEGQSIGDWMPAMDFSDRTLQRTSDWEPVEKEIIDDGSPAPSLDTGFGSPLCQEGEAISFRTAASEMKSKPKSRGTGRTEHTPFIQAQIQVLEEQVPGKPRLFHLKERDLKVFHGLFYQPSNENAVGKIKFHDFLHAMSSVGFSYQKMGGSAWLFVPPTEWATRGISFHEPHGMDTKISFCMARQIGRRLQRVYGWGRSTFVAE
ncbi:hypothetical protein EG328_009400 [Venturia inaequalis]|uniref:Uncharacterized protein n=1 Tax=Venturia inaequalis TaxID=5025 RepID=A0A8H3U8F1_VENIN|nr:hypothetical protein EG328_009400 [Venturia inaequalis]KAE9994804.1 hypothetical protein EG327_000017 [Venturia inaequalis]